MLGISQGSECEFSKFLISSGSRLVDKSYHSGLTCRSTRHEIITRYRGVILSRITYRKKRSCLFSSATARRKKPKDSFSSDWAEELAESDKGSYFDQEQSASRSKITVEEPLTDLESTETWQKFYGHAIVAGQRLQEKINESVTCRFCQESVELVENLGSKNGLGSIWMFQCQNESCPSHETNLPFPTMEKKQGARDKLCIGSWLSSYRSRSRDSLKGF